MRSRRNFAAVLAGGGLAACKAWGKAARLTARPVQEVAGCEAGLHSLGLRKERDAALYVPQSADAGKPAPLVMYLHGATGSEKEGVRRMSGLADQFGFLLLCPASEDGTWDGIREGYGDDVRAIDRALASTFGKRRVDARRLALAGFSDGASYGLGIGLANGDLFTEVMAFSPGFIPPGSTQTGTPRVFLSHGTRDTILPIETCSRRLVPELQRAGYKVTYREFDGPHGVPPEIATEAMKWFLGG